MSGMRPGAIERDATTRLSHGERRAVRATETLLAAGAASREEGPQLPMRRPKEDGFELALPPSTRPGGNNGFSPLPIRQPLRRQKEAAFDDLFDRHSLALFKLAMVKVRNYQDAQDIVSETFLRAWRGWEEFRGESTEITWLSAICKRVCIDYWRRNRKRLRDLSFDELLSNSGAPEQELVQLPGGPERDDVLDLLAAITRLPQKERRGFVLTKLCGFSVTETADEILDIPRTTLESRLKAASRRLAVERYEPSSREGA